MNTKFDIGENVLVYATVKKILVTDQGTEYLLKSENWVTDQSYPEGEMIKVGEEDKLSGYIDGYTTGRMEGINYILDKDAQLNERRNEHA